MSLSAKNKTARGFEIENVGVSGNFDDDGAKRRAGERIKAGAQGCRCIGSANEKKPFRMNSEFEKSAG